MRARRAKRILLVLLGAGLVLGPWLYHRAARAEGDGSVLHAVTPLLPQELAGRLRAYVAQRQRDDERRYWASVSALSDPLLKLTGEGVTEPPIVFTEGVNNFMGRLVRPGHPPLELRLPKGCVNLARGRPVTSSESEEPIIGQLSLITDGSAQHADGDWVELWPPRDAPQWVQVDLGASRDLVAVRFWHYPWDYTVYRDVIVLAGDDAAFEGGYRVLFNNDHDGSSGLGTGNDPLYMESHLGQTVIASPCRARYVRFYSHGSCLGQANNYLEVEVWGMPKSPTQ